MSTRDEFLERLDVVEARLAAAAASEPAPGALTDADPSSGERWDRGQVWAHLAEFTPYWIEQMRPVIDGQLSGEPVRFGRTHANPERIGAIERDRREPVTELWAATRENITLLRAFLRELSPDQWAAVGQHITRGAMSVPEIIEEFLVGHLEQHADQLERLSRAPG
jgi:DinB superfamily